MLSFARVALLAMLIVVSLSAFALPSLASPSPDTLDAALSA